jgi:hypothetical protein
VNQTVHQPARANRRNGELGSVSQADPGRESTLDEKGEKKVKRKPGRLNPAEAKPESRLFHTPVGRILQDPARRGAISYRPVQPKCVYPFHSPQY